MRTRSRKETHSVGESSCCHLVELGDDQCLTTASGYEHQTIQWQEKLQWTPYTREEVVKLEIACGSWCCTKSNDERYVVCWRANYSVIDIGQDQASVIRFST